MASRLATHAPGEARMRRCAATRKPRIPPKMAHSVVVELPLKGEEQKAMLFRADLHLFVCGFKVNAGSYEWRLECFLAAWTAPDGDAARNILDDSVFEALVGLCWSGIVALIMLAPPCKEYSRLKLRPGGPKAVETSLSRADARKKWPLGIAVGKLNVVFTEGKEPRLVLDSTVCQVNTRCQLPERLSLPMASDSRSKLLGGRMWRRPRAGCATVC